MKNLYNALEFHLYYNEDLETLIRLAKDPEVYLSYCVVSEHDGEDVLLDKDIRFVALVPKELAETKYAAEDEKYGDDQYEIEITEGYGIEKMIILSDLYDLRAVSKRLEDMRKRYVGWNLHNRTVKE